jgi:succinoglycan biosynthesis transport protein ExoP
MLNDQFSGAQSSHENDASLVRARSAGGRVYNDDSRLNPWGYNDASSVLSRKAVDDAGADNTIRQVLGMLGRRKILAIATLLTVLGLTMLYLMLTPAVYDAKATLQIYASEGGTTEGSGTDVSTLVNSSGGTGADRSYGTQLTILQSPLIRKGAISRLSEETQAKLQSHLSVSITPVLETTLVEIVVSSHDAEASAQLANAFCDEYVQLSRAENRGQLQAALDYVRVQKAKIGQRLNQARSDVQKFKEENKLITVDSAATAAAGAVLSIKTEREKLKVDQAEVRAGIQRATQLIPTMPEYKVRPGQIVVPPQVTAIKGKITTLNLQRLEYLQKYRADRPEIIAIDDQLKSLHAQLQQEAKTEVGIWSNELNPRRDGLESSLVDLRAKDWAMQARESALAQAEVQAAAKMNQMPALERKFSDMTLNLLALEKSYAALNEKQESLRMSQEARIANGSRLFPAETPTSPSNRNQKLMFSALLIGLFLAVALAALVDWLDDGVYGEVEARTVSQLPILAQITALGKDAQQQLTTNADASSDNKQIQHMRENFRMLRTMIALSSAQENSHYSGNGSAGVSTLATTNSPFAASPVRSVVITSSLPNEGKSVSSANLAITAALSGESVILVDCDLRHPSLHRFFDLSNDIGLTSVVGGACTLNEALQDTRIPGLRILTAGPVTLDPMQILNSAGARRCLEQLSEIADFVVIDTPPALVYAEAQVIAAMTDAMLLVISSQDAKKREVTRTRDLLEQTGMIPLGVILNKMPAGSDNTQRYYERYNA